MQLSNKFRNCLTLINFRKHYSRASELRRASVMSLIVLNRYVLQSALRLICGSCIRSTQISILKQARSVRVYRKADSIVCVIIDTPKLYPIARYTRRERNFVKVMNDVFVSMSPSVHPRINKYYVRTINRQTFTNILLSVHKFVDG